MKKIIVLCVVVLSLSQLNTVFADEYAGLLREIPPHQTFGVKYAERLTDGFFNQTASFTMPNQYTKAYAEWDLNQEYNIRKIALKWYNAGSYFMFFDKNGNLITEIPSHNIAPEKYANNSTPPAIYDTYIPKVKKIRIEHRYYAKIGLIYEFDVFGDPVEYEKPNPPTNVQAVAGDKQIIVSWEKTQNEIEVQGFFIYLDNTRITPNPVHSPYTIQNLTNGRKYKIEVSAYSVDGVESLKSEPVYATPQEPPPPATPTGLTGTAGNGSVTLFWNAVSDPDLVGYHIYQDGKRITTTPITTTTYTVNGLINGRAYTFEVTAISKSGRESAKSNALTLKPEKPPVQPPENVETSPGSDNNGNYLLIRWDEVPDAVGYKIYIDGKFVAQVPAGTTEYKAYGYDPNKEYRIEVTAISPDGEESEPGKAPDKWDQAKENLKLTARDLLVATFQFIMVFANIILLILVSIFGPRIYRFLKHVAKEKGVKF